MSGRVSDAVAARLDYWRRALAAAGTDAAVADIDDSQLAAALAAAQRQLDAAVTFEDAGIAFSAARRLLAERDRRAARPAPGGTS
jgi:hypothetical protein